MMNTRLPHIFASTMWCDCDNNHFKLGVGKLQFPWKMWLKRSDQKYSNCLKHECQHILRYFNRYDTLTAFLFMRIWISFISFECIKERKKNWILNWQFQRDSTHNLLFKWLTIEFMTSDLNFFFQNDKRKNDNGIDFPRSCTGTDTATKYDKWLYSRWSWSLPLRSTLLGNSAAEF